MRLTAGLSLRRFRSWARPRLPDIVFLAVTTGVGLWAAGRWIDPVGDPGFSWSLAYRLSHGERLYRDIYLAYGPLSPYLLALWARWIGVSSLSMLLANWIPAILAGLLLIRCGRRFLSPFEGICLAGMILATSLFVPGTGRLVFPYYAGVTHAFVFALAGLSCLEPGRTLPGRALLAGALAGLAFCCKQEIGIAALAALLIPVVTGAERRLRWGAAVLAGFCAVLLPAAAFVLSWAPLESLRLRSHLWPLNPRPPAQFDLLFRSVSGFADPGWFAALRASVWGLLARVAALAALAGLLARERRPAAWRRWILLGSGLALWWAAERFPPSLAFASPLRLSALIAFLVVLLALLRRQTPGRTFLVGFGLFAGLTGLRAAVSPFSTGAYDGPARFAAGLTWLLFLLVLVPPLVWADSRAARLTRHMLAGALFLFCWWDAASGAESLRFPWKAAVETPNGRVFLEPGQAAFFRAVGSSLTPGERVLVLPEINAVDALFRVRSASPLLQHFPGWLDTRLEAELIGALEKSPPRKVIVFTRGSSEFGVGGFGTGFGAPLAEWCLRRSRVAFSSPRGMILELRIDPALSGAPPAAGK